MAVGSVLGVQSTCVCRGSKKESRRGFVWTGQEIAGYSVDKPPSSTELSIPTCSDDIVRTLWYGRCGQGATPRQDVTSP